jgi:hypothetical protein
MVDDQYTNPDVIFTQYQLGFAALADEDIDAVSAASSSGTGAASTSTSGGTVGSGGSGGGGGFRPCFVEGTPVMLANRKYFPIEKIGKGWFVTAFDDHGRLHPAKVLDVYVHEVAKHLSVEFWDGRATGVTGEHPYWQGGKLFVPIGELGLRSFVLHYENLAWNQVGIKDKNLILLEKPILVYNLEVEEFQTYIANGDGVHNLRALNDD